MFGELIAWYLFFGGMAGGAYLVGILIEACTAHACRKAQVVRLSEPVSADGGGCEYECRAATWAHFRARVRRPILLVSVLAAAVGSVCLLGDLVRPEQAHILFTRPVFSVLNIGALALAFFLALVAALLLADIKELELPQLVLGTLRVLATVLAAVIIVYTGIYLNSIWTIAPWSSMFLIPLFLFSSLATGLGVPYLVMGVINMNLREFLPQFKVLAWADIVFLIGEMVSLVAMFLQSGAFSDKSPFMLFFSDELRLPFLLGFVGCGILIPLLLDILQLKTRSIGPWHALILGFVTMAGGYSLRYCVMSVSVVFRAMTIATIGV